MSFFEAVFLGIVEGVTEFLPISSTGHLLIVEHLFGLVGSAFYSSFSIAIQLGAVLAVAAIYIRKVLRHPKVIIPVGIAFVPTAVIGFALYAVIKDVLFANIAIVIAALFIGGVLMLFLEKKFGKTLPKDDDHKRSVDEALADHHVSLVSPKKAFLIGLCQSLAVIPGVSRSAATIMGGLAMKMTREEIVEFSFLLAVPTMLAATAYDLLQTSYVFTSKEWLSLGIGMVSAFITAFFVVKWLLRYISRGTFVAFAWYRIGIAAVLALYFYVLE